MYAMIQTGGKQYRVQQGDVIYVEKLEKEVGEEVSFQVLVLQNDENVKIGTPVVDDAEVVGRVLGQGKSAKLIVFKMKAKKTYRKKRGHRQPFTKVEIMKITG